MKAVLVVEFDADELDLYAIPNAARALETAAGLPDDARLYAAIREDADRVLAVFDRKEQP
jgi:hypothetical protein